MKFLKPQWANTFLTIFLLLLPLIPEHVVLPTGGYILVRYVPVSLLYDAVRSRQYSLFFGLLGSSLVLYVVVSLVLNVFSLLLRKMKKV